MVSKFIKRIGIEIEAAWIDPKMQERLHEDLSFGRNDFDPKYKSVGELTSVPMDSLDEVLDWLKINYPDASCNKNALHVHCEIIDVPHYSELMSHNFYDYFLQKMKEFGEKNHITLEEFWTRLDGANRYAQRAFRPDKQAAMKKKGTNNPIRRTQLNYCFSIFKTIETRMLPMFKSYDTAKAAIMALINCFDSYLENNPPKEKAIMDDLLESECDTIDDDTHILIKKCFDERINELSQEMRHIEDEAELRILKRKLNATKEQQSFLVKSLFKSEKTKIFSFNYFEEDFSYHNISRTLPDKKQQLGDGWERLKERIEFNKPLPHNEDYEDLPEDLTPDAPEEGDKKEEKRGEIVRGEIIRGEIIYDKRKIYPKKPEDEKEFDEDNPVQSARKEFEKEIIREKKLLIPDDFKWIAASPGQIPKSPEIPF